MVKFGVSFPMTGDFSEYGELLFNGMQLAIDQTNNKGGIDGKQIELVLEDSKGIPEEAERIARKFTQDPEILLELGDFSSPASMAAAPIYEQAGMAQIAPVTSHPDFTRMGDNMVRVVAIQPVESHFLARYASERLNVSDAAIVYLNNSWGEVAKKAFKEKADEVKINVIAEEPIELGQTNFKDTLEVLMGANPDVVYIASEYAETARFLEQARDAGFEAEFMNSGAPQSFELVRVAGDSAEGLIGGALYHRENPEPTSAAFTADYERRFNSQPNLFAALGYDAGLLAVYGAANAKGERNRVASTILTLSDFSGATGHFDYSTSRDPDKNYMATTVQNGKWVILNN